MQYIKPLLIDLDGRNLVDKGQRVSYQHFMQFGVQENLSQADIFSDYQEKLRQFLPKLDVQIFGVVDCDDAFHVFLQY